MSDDIDNFMPWLEKVASQVGAVLEIGVGKGTGSTLAFMRGLEKRDRLLPARMISVDRIDYMEAKPDSRLWSLILGDSRERSTLERVALEFCHSPDIIFIDTDHTPEQITAELNLWQEIAGVYTLWLFHDTYMMGVYNPMTDTIKQWAAERGWIYEDVFTEAHGLGCMHRD